MGKASSASGYRGQALILCPLEIVVMRVGSAGPPVKPDTRQDGERKRTLPRWLKISGWPVTNIIAFISVIIAFIAVAISFEQYSAQRSQIAALQRTTPTGEITGMTAYRTSGRQLTITNMRNDPVLRQQIYDLSGVASDVPDNGNLFMVAHEYGQLTTGLNDPSNHYYITPVPLQGKSDTDQYWNVSEVYIGERSAPDSSSSFRLTLYFCDSVDAEEIVKAISSTAVDKYGLLSLPYSSCKQLDSIFVTRG
jgi:hypothetical protein